MASPDLILISETHSQLCMEKLFGDSFELQVIAAGALLPNKLCRQTSKQSQRYQRQTTRYACWLPCTV
jgi:hypothetical protein